jgi:membrane protein YdbS with pleckstrin-like domain
MKCAACQREVPDGSAFCPGCGAAMTGDAPTLASRMKSAVNRNPGNQPAEDDLWVGTYSPKAMAGPAIGLAILTVIAIVVGTFVPPIGWMVAGIGAVVAWLVLAFVVLYRQKTVNYRLTTFRLFHESGLLARTRDRIEVIDINDVNLSQGILERMFNVGTIHIDSSDKSHPNFNMLGIENVRAVADLVDNTRRAERQRRAVFMENVGDGPPGTR